MVAKRKARKDEVRLPPAARDNPYAMCSREELDAALKEVDAALAALPEDALQRTDLRATRTLVVQGYLWRMVRMGLATWAGGKPKGSTPPIPVTPGPYISDYVIEDRR